MTVHAGDLAMYQPARGEREKCAVHGRTAKRVAIIVRRGGEYLVRYVKAERLERLRGGLLNADDER